MTLPQRGPLAITSSAMSHATAIPQRIRSLLFIRVPVALLFVHTGEVRLLLGLILLPLDLGDLIIIVGPVQSGNLRAHPRPVCGWASVPRSWHLSHQSQGRSSRASR